MILQYIFPRPDQSYLYCFSLLFFLMRSMIFLPRRGIQPWCSLKLHYACSLPLCYRASPCPALVLPCRRYITLVLDAAGRAVCAYGLLYDSPCRGVLDFGKELSAFRGLYRYAEFETGDLDYYMAFGKGVVSGLQCDRAST